MLLKMTSCEGFGRLRLFMKLRQNEITYHRSIKVPFTVTNNYSIIVTTKQFYMIEH
jgi:hypothetical protein